MPFQYEVQRRSITDDDAWVHTNNFGPLTEGTNTNMLPGRYQYRMRTLLGNDSSSWSAVQAIDVWPPGLLIAFDGTSAQESSNTNVYKISTAYKPQVQYERGVGNADDHTALGALWQTAFATEALAKVMDV